MTLPKQCATCLFSLEKVDDIRTLANGTLQCVYCGCDPRTVVKGHDPVNHPSHYNWLPKGIEVIDITELFNFNRGNALKYIMRAGRKDGADEIEDLSKARFYLDREIKNLEAARKAQNVAHDPLISSHPFIEGLGGKCNHSIRIESDRTYCGQPRERHTAVLDAPA